MSIVDILDKIPSQEGNQHFPTIVPGRVLHADGDAFSYRAYREDESFQSNLENLKIIINTWRRIAGAEHIVIHLTLGEKGGRERWATVQPYQEHRIKNRDPAKQERVYDLRLAMAGMRTKYITGRGSIKQEADDTMCKAMHDAWDKGEEAVLFMPDKDSYMIPGKHLDPNTCTISDYPKGYGRCMLREANNKNNVKSKKLIGKGTSFFWHQMLMGDAADNIPGLPMLSADMCIKYIPNTSYVRLQRRIQTGRMPSGKLLNHKQKQETLQKYTECVANYKPKKLGAVSAYEILRYCNSDLSAYERVWECYEDFYKHNSPGYAQDMFHEQARLLWMQMFEGDDVVMRLNGIETYDTDLYGRKGPWHNDDISFP